MPREYEILQYFEYSHLPEKLAAVSRPFCELAYSLVYGDSGQGLGTYGGPLPDNAEKSVALRKLLEAKDAAVRAAVTK